MSLFDSPSVDLLDYGSNDSYDEDYLLSSDDDSFSFDEDNEEDMYYLNM